MDALINYNDRSNPPDASFGSLSRTSQLMFEVLAFLLLTLSFPYLTEATTTLQVSDRTSSSSEPTQQSLSIQDRKNQWFFAEAIAKSLWELATYAEKLTSSSRSDRVETLQQIYTALMNIEGEIALKRKNLANQHGITDALMSHLANVLTDEQKSAFDVYMLEVIALHQDAATMIQQDTFLKSYYEHLLALNGITVFLERFQEFLRSREFQMDKRATF
jgi:hypothetical protein